MLKSALMLLSSGLAVRLLDLLRTVILTRLLTVEDYGIVATFLLATSLVQMVSATGLDILVVQDREGDNPKFVAAVQTLQLVRSVLGAATLVLLGGVYARIMGVEGLVWPYQLLAFFPLATGFINLNLYQAQRTGDFRTIALWTALTPLFGLALLGVLLLIFDDWRIGLFLVVGSQIFGAISSQFFAKGRYRLGWEKTYMRRALAFGLPLVINSLLLFLVINGDRIIVSNQLGLEALAFMSIALGLAQVPVSILAKVHQTLFMPQLARNQDNPEAFDQAMVLALQSRMALALIPALFLALFGPDLAFFLYGEKYATIGALVIWAGLFNAIRTLKAGPGTVAISLGYTRNPLYANLLRVMALPFAFWAVTQGAELVTLMQIAVTAELMAFLLSLGLLFRARKEMPPGVLSAAAASVSVFMLIALDVQFFPPVPVPFNSFHMAQILLVLAGLAAAASMGKLRQWTANKLKQAIRARRR